MAVKIGAETGVVGLFGDPIAHSISPQFQNAAFRALKLPLCYLAFQVKAEELSQAVAGARTLGFKGFNVTIPHKRAIITYLDEITPFAQKLGAVNTVKREGDRLIGYNTDGEGFIRSLTRCGFDSKGKVVLLLGAGGAARAVAYALAQEGAEQIVIANRTMEHALDLVSDLTAEGVQAAAINLSQLPSFAKVAQVIVNTSPVGMYPYEDAEPIIPSRLIEKEHLVCDLIYNPRPTRLLREARERGAETLDGLGMLVWQGALACEIWTGKLPPIEVLEDAAKSALAGE